MPVYFAYILVVLIWSTTPLGIQWSSDSVSFVAAATLRMSLALVLALLINALLRRALFDRPGVWKVYLVASLGIFPNMPLVYWCAQFVPSGLMAVIFALSPFSTGLWSLLLLRENPFSLRRVLALLVALCGLLLVFRDQLHVNVSAALGMTGLLLSCFLFGFSSVLLKRLDKGSDPFNQTVGSLLFALPGLLLVWWLLDGQWPSAMSDRTLWGIGYLAILGSLGGFTLYYFVLSRTSASTVSLLTLITPVLALMVGAVVAGERLTLPLLAGTALILSALVFYLDFPLVRHLRRWLTLRLTRGEKLETGKNA